VKAPSAQVRYKSPEGPRPQDDISPAYNYDPHPLQTHGVQKEKRYVSPSYHTVQAPENNSTRSTSPLPDNQISIETPPEDLTKRTASPENQDRTVFYEDPVPRSPPVIYPTDGRSVPEYVRAEDILQKVDMYLPPTRVPPIKKERPPSQSFSSKDHARHQSYTRSLSTLQQDARIPYNLNMGNDERDSSKVSKPHDKYHDMASDTKSAVWTIFTDMLEDNDIKTILGSQDDINNPKEWTDDEWQTAATIVKEARRELNHPEEALPTLRNRGISPQLISELTRALQYLRMMDTQVRKSHDTALHDLKKQILDLTKEKIEITGKEQTQSRQSRELEGKLQDKNSMIQYLQNQCEAIVEENFSLRIEMESNRAAIRNLQNTTTTEPSTNNPRQQFLESNYDTARTDYSDKLENDIREKDKEMIEMNKKIQLLQEQYNKIEKGQDNNTIQTLQDENEKIYQELEDKLHELNRLANVEMNYQDIVQKHDEIVQLLNRKDAELTNLVNAHEELLGNRNELVRILNQKDAELTDYADSNKELQIKLSYETDYQEKRLQNRLLEQENLKYDIQGLVDEVKKGNDQLTLNYQTLSTDSTASQKIHDGLKQDIEKLQRKIDIKEEEISSLQKSVLSAQDDMKEKEKDIISLQKENDMSQTLYETMKCDNERLHKKLENKEIEYERLRQQLRGREHEFEQTIKLENERLHKKIEHKEDEFDRLQRKIEGREQDLERLQRRLEEKEEIIISHHKNSLISQEKIMEKENEILALLQGDHKMNSAVVTEHLRRMIQEQQEEMKNLKDNESTFQTVQNENQLHLQKLSQENAKLQFTNHNLNTEIKRLNDNAQKIASEDGKALVNLTQKNVVLDTALNNTNHQIQELQEKIKKLQTDLNKEKNNNLATGDINELLNKKNRQIQDLNKEKNDNLIQTTGDINELLNKKNHQIQEFQIKIKKLEELVVSAEVSCSSYSCSSSSSSSENERALQMKNQQIKDLQEELRILQEMTDKEKRNNSEFTYQKDRQINDLQAIQQKQKFTIDQCNQLLQQKENEINELNITLQKSKDETRIINTNIDRPGDNQDEQIEHIEQIEQDIVLPKNEQNELRPYIINLNEQIECLSSNNNILQQQIERLNTNNNILQQQLQQKENEIVQRDNISQLAHESEISHNAVLLEQQILKKEKEIKEHHQKLEHLKNEYDETVLAKDQIIKQKDAEIIKLKSDTLHLSQQENEIVQHENKIEYLQNLVDKVQETLNQRNIDIRQKNDEILLLKNDYDEMLDKKKKEIHRRDDEIILLNKTFQQQLVQKENEIIQKDHEAQEEINELNKTFQQQLVQKENQLIQKDQEVAITNSTLQQQINSKENEIIQRDQELQNIKNIFQQQLIQKEHEVVQREQDSAFRNKNVLQQQILQKENEIVQRDTEIKNLKHSYEDDLHQKDRELAQKNADIMKLKITHADDLHQKDRELAQENADITDLQNVHADNLRQKERESQLLQDEHQQFIESMQKDNDSQMKELQNNIDHQSDDVHQLLENQIDDLKVDHNNEIDRIKKTHDVALDKMKNDHHDELMRWKEKQVVDGPMMGPEELRVLMEQLSKNEMVVNQLNQQLHDELQKRKDDQTNMLELHSEVEKLERDLENERESGEYMRSELKNIIEKMPSELRLETEAILNTPREIQPPKRSYSSNNEWKDKVVQEMAIAKFLTNEFSEKSDDTEAPANHHISQFHRTSQNTLRALEEQGVTNSPNKEHQRISQRVTTLAKYDPATDQFFDLLERERAEIIAHRNHLTETNKVLDQMEKEACDMSKILNQRAPDLKSFIDHAEGSLRLHHFDEKADTLVLKFNGFLGMLDKQQHMMADSTNNPRHKIESSELFLKTMEQYMIIAQQAVVDVLNYKTKSLNDILYEVDASMLRIENATSLPLETSQPLRIVQTKSPPIINVQVDMSPVDVPTVTVYHRPQTEVMDTSPLSAPGVPEIMTYTPLTQYALTPDATSTLTSSMQDHMIPMDPIKPGIQHSHPELLRREILPDPKNISNNTTTPTIKQPQFYDTGIPRDHINISNNPSPPIINQPQFYDTDNNIDIPRDSFVSKDSGIGSEESQRDEKGKGRSNTNTETTLTAQERRARFHNLKKTESSDNPPVTENIEEDALNFTQSSHFTYESESDNPAPPDQSEESDGVSQEGSEESEFSKSDAEEYNQLNEMSDARVPSDHLSKEGNTFKATPLSFNNNNDNQFSPSEIEDDSFIEDTLTTSNHNRGLARMLDPR